ncbi:MAG: diguanylate cyclase [Campylobacterota bacterium]|nr:diguanylate cyclase [Campylobacterota bacterium]
MSDLIKVHQYTKMFKVLYVEDNKDLQEQIMQSFGVLFDQVDVRDDGQAGLESYNEYFKTNEKYYDLVITDLHMPRMDGIELIKEILLLNSSQAIIVISAHSDSKSLISLLNMGVNGFIIKPINEQQMCNALEKVSNIISNQKKLILCNEKFDALSLLTDADINEVFEQNQLLQSERNAFETLYQKSTDGILLYKNNIILDCNDASVSMLQYQDKSKLIGNSLIDLSAQIQPNGYTSEKIHKKMIEKTLQSGHNRFEWVYQKQNGEEFWVEVVMTKLNYIHDQQVIHISWRDISKTKELEEELIYMAKKDYLTGISNRRDFFDQAKKLYDNNDSIFIVMLDLDRFKKINDTYGHKTGDEVLKLFTKTINKNIARDVLFARLGGEEFILMYCNEDKNELLQKIEELRLKIENLRFNSNDKEIQFTTSMGIASRNDTHDSIDALMHDADEALYQAKNDGRNKVKFRA